MSCWGGLQCRSVTKEGAELDAELSLILSSLPKALCPDTELLLLKLEKDSHSVTHTLGAPGALPRTADSQFLLTGPSHRTLRHRASPAHSTYNAPIKHRSGGGRHGCRRMLG